MKNKCKNCFESLDTDLSKTSAPYYGSASGAGGIPPKFSDCKKGYYPYKRKRDWFDVLVIAVVGLTVVNIVVYSFISLMW